MDITTQEDHKIYFCGGEVKQMNGIEFLVHKNFVNTNMDCRPIYSKPFTIRLKIVPFNITVIQVRAPIMGAHLLQVNEVGETRLKHDWDAPRIVVLVACALKLTLNIPLLEMRV
ncbi:hypothetical protein RRG08_035556 [Elysia crispata]|uniref:Uncharacterized protein n=1 Tax=Elysia crispata TaxID=231223 RepID=A0AAE1B5E1_9GAST|nr:hypothetical protein RRG08_035556 [Elysia crispata]